MSKKGHSFSPEFMFQVVMDLVTGRKRRAEILHEHPFCGRLALFPFYVPVVSA